MAKSNTYSRFKIPHIKKPDIEIPAQIEILIHSHFLSSLKGACSFVRKKIFFVNIWPHNKFVNISHFHCSNYKC